MKIRFCLLVFMAVTTIVCCKEGNNIVESDDSIYGDWRLVSDIQCVNTENIECQPENDHYPIVLSFVSSDRICGYHDANSYESTYRVNDNQLYFEDISITDVMDNEWYTNYISVLRYVYKYDNSNPDTLKLIAENDSHTLVFLSKNKFNTNVDSIYSYFSMCEIDSLNIENALQGSSWVLIYVEANNFNIEHPIDMTTLSILPNDSIYGRSGDVSYYGKCVIDDNKIGVSANYDNLNVSYCFANYVKALTSVTSFNVNNDSLKLMNDNNSSLLEFVKMFK
ncbi:MAG: hypothetical protein IKZ99_07410 [Salinivirgaceae bacterium]|nr:hypothetical protein [Salinivirgaceae bacterium]